MGVGASPPRYPWPKPWASPASLFGAVDRQGFFFDPVGSWPVNFRPTAINVTIQLDQDSYVSIFAENNAVYPASLDSPDIGYIYNVFYPAGTYVMTVPLDFTVNRDIFFLQIQLGSAPYTGVVLDITFVGGAVTPTIFWTERVLCVES